jgi:hypothetical protein
MREQEPSGAAPGQAGKPHLFRGAEYLGCAFDFSAPYADDLEPIFRYDFEICRNPVAGSKNRDFVISPTELQGQVVHLRGARFRIWQIAIDEE